MNDYMTRALANIDDTIDSHRRFPENVFLGRWEEFLFFDPDWIFDKQFPGAIKTLLDSENALCACLKNLTPPSLGAPSEQASIFLDKQTNPETYFTFLSKPVGIGWLYRMDNYGCTSDVGDWCMYCERNNEIAVIAVRKIHSDQRFRSITGFLNALPIQQAIAAPFSYGLSPRVLSPAWREGLLKEYSEMAH